jgi:hypothetical protein
MNIPIKIFRHDISKLQNVLTLMLQINIDFIDYVEFYNLSNLIQKVQKLNFKLNFSDKQNFTLNFDPNEAQNFLALVTLNSNLINQNDYFKALLIRICNDIHTKLHTLNSQKQNFANKLVLTIPKQLNT